MAETFKLITGLPEDRPRVYNLAAKTTDEAMRYLRYLNRNAMFGTHTGLPKKMRNSNENESLVSNIGDYSVLDVFAYPQTSCIIGTVVNFHISDDVNTLGSTYVYPCTDKDKPMGYMISDATPDKLGVCLVHGVIEVPLYYFSGSTEEKTDYVEYDIENACFKFSDSGYPVFNVYQDVDGDWIAIILFGDIGAGEFYDGPFATSVADISGSTIFVNVSAGDVYRDNERFSFSGIDYKDLLPAQEDLLYNLGLNTGETLWLGVNNAVTNPYSFQKSYFMPEDSLGNTFFYRIAKNENGVLKQLCYGDVFKYTKDDDYKGPFDFTLVSAIPISEDNEIIGMRIQCSILDSSYVHVDSDVHAGYVVIGGSRIPVSGGHSLTYTCSLGSDEIEAELYLYLDSDGTYKFKLVGRGDVAGYTSLEGKFYTTIAHVWLLGYSSQVQYGDVVQPSGVSGSTVGYQNLYTSTVAIPGSTLSQPVICLTDSNDYVKISGSTNVYVESGGHNEIVIGCTISESSLYQDLTNNISGGTATIGLTHSLSNVNFNGKGNVEITGIRATASSEEIASWGNRPDGTSKNVGWKGIIPLSDGRVMTEETIGVQINGEEFNIPFIVPNMDDDDLYVISLYATGKIGFNDIPTAIIDKARNWAVDRIDHGKSPYYNGPNEEDDALRNVDTESIIILGLDEVQDIYSYVSGSTAYLGLTGHESSVQIIGGTNTTIRGGNSGEIFIDAVVSGSTSGGSGFGSHYFWHDLTTLSGGTFTNVLEAEPNCTYDILTEFKEDGSSGISFDKIENVYRIEAKDGTTSYAGTVAGNLLIVLPNIDVTDTTTHDIFVEFYVDTYVDVTFIAPQNITGSTISIPIVNTYSTYGNNSATIKLLSSGKGHYRLVYFTEMPNNEYPNGVWLWNNMSY